MATLFEPCLKLKIRECLEEGDGYKMQTKTNFGPFGLVAEIIIVSLAALGVAAMFQDYAYFFRADSITPENILLKYGVVVTVIVFSTILMRKRRQSTNDNELSEQ